MRASEYAAAPILSHPPVSAACPVRRLFFIFASVSEPSPPPLPPHHPYPPPPPPLLPLSLPSVPLHTRTIHSPLDREETTLTTSLSSRAVRHRPPISVSMSLRCAGYTGGRTIALPTSAQRNHPHTLHWWSTSTRTLCTRMAPLAEWVPTEPPIPATTHRLMRTPRGHLARSSGVRHDRDLHRLDDGGAVGRGRSGLRSAPRRSPLESPRGGAEPPAHPTPASKRRR